MTQDLKLRVEELVDRHAAALPHEPRASLSAALLQLVEAEITSVRERAVALCIRRGELWRETGLRGGRLQEEARARSNEAFYLADMIETGQDFPDSEPSGGTAASGGIEARGVSS